MRYRTAALVAGLLLAAVAENDAQQRRRASAVRLQAVVVRSCSIDHTSDDSAPVRVTCSRNATPGVVTSVAPLIVRVPPPAASDLDADQAADPNVTAAPELAGTPGAGVASDGDSVVEFQVVTINF